MTAKIACPLSVGPKERKLLLVLKGKSAAAPPGGASRIARVLAGYGRVLDWVVIALMAALALDVTLGVGFRALGRALAWYDEVASVLLAWLTFYGSAAGGTRGNAAPSGKKDRKGDDDCFPR